MLIRIIAAVLFFLSSQLCAKEDCSRVETSKMKVDLAEISFQKDGMYWFLKNQPVKILALQCENGTYTAVVPKNIVEDVLGVWRCFCGWYNSRFDHHCARCGRAKP
jgi:hypothetical protein